MNAVVNNITRLHFLKSNIFISTHHRSTPCVLVLHYRTFSSNQHDADQSSTPLKNVSLFKNPIVHQLWTARQEAKARRGDAKRDVSKGKPPLDSRVEVLYPFSTNELLLESYRNPWGQMRFGKMIEDLDALAGNIAFHHVDDGGEDFPTIVTASVDGIRLSSRPRVGSDQYLSGQVTWTGNSSMEIRMQCMDSSEGEPNQWLEAFVTFVTLDSKTHKPIKIPPVVPQTEEENLLFQQGAHRATVKKRLRTQHQLAYSEEVDEIAQNLVAEAGPLLNMPSLADPHSILMNATKMKHGTIAQPQVSNLHNRIFGGFLMRKAFELAFANAYMFGGARPIFLEVDDVSFQSPVDVGDLLVFHTRVLYTELGRLSDYYTHHDSLDEVPILHVEVEAWVTEPERAFAKLSNQFYFTFAIKTDRQVVRRVLPSNIDEARRIALRILADRAQSER